MSEPEELIGRTIAGKYQLRRLLGVGGMGAVYEGLHTELGKRVAVKVITAQTGLAESEIAQRFRREARAASAVESEHIVQVFDVGQDPELGLYMVMEYLEGEDLSTRLAREGRLDTTSAVMLASQALRGLAKAHAVGVIHRDLKPANIYLMSREDGSMLVKILDFGISKFLREENEPASEKQNQKLTRVGSVLGTPQYMSPEQAQGLPIVDHRSDIWSMGAVLYEALAGRPAYEDHPTYEQTIIQIVTARATRITEVAPWVPVELADVVHAALVHDVATRIPDCIAFVRALNEVVPHLGPDASVRLVGMSEGKILAAAEARLRSAVAVTAEGPAAPVAAEPVRHDGKSGTTTGLVSNMPVLSELPPIPGIGRRRATMPIAIGLVGLFVVAAGAMTLRHRSVVANASANTMTAESSLPAPPTPFAESLPATPKAAVETPQVVPTATTIPAQPTALAAGKSSARTDPKAPTRAVAAPASGKAAAPTKDGKPDDATKDAKPGSTKRFGGVDLSDSYD